jgi:uncharacterized protein (TIGR03086 family)
MMAGTPAHPTTGVGVVSAEWRMLMASDPMKAPVDHHRRACAGFGEVVGQVGDRWGRPSPCTEWDARGVLEHVIGFHDVLLLRPFSAKPQRPKDDPVVRWQVTEAAISGLIGGRRDHVVEVPGDRVIDLVHLLPMLTTDVLVHTWDLARAADLPIDLDPELCQLSMAAAGGSSAIAASGLYDPPVDVPADANIQARLVACMGRDPRWVPG